MTVKIKVEGLKAVQVALRELPKSAAKNVMRRVLKKRAEPIVAHARDLAPKDQGDLRESIAVSTKLTKRQRGRHRKFGRDDVEVFIGAGPHPQAHLQEFGTKDHGPQPFMRPAWDAKKSGLLVGIAKDLWTEIRRATDRLARKLGSTK